MKQKSKQKHAPLKNDENDYERRLTLTTKRLKTDFLWDLSTSFPISIFPVYEDYLKRNFRSWRLPGFGS